MHCDTQPKPISQYTLIERRTERIRRWELHKAVIEAIFKGLKLNWHHKNITARMHQAVKDEVIKLFPKPDGWENEYWPSYPSVSFRAYCISVANGQPGLVWNRSEAQLYVGQQYGPDKEKTTTWQQHAERSYTQQTENLNSFIGREKILSGCDWKLRLLAQDVENARSDAKLYLMNNGVNVDKHDYDLSYDHPLLFGDPKKRDYDQL